MLGHIDNWPHKTTAKIPNRVQTEHGFVWKTGDAGETQQVTQLTHLHIGHSGPLHCRIPFLAVFFIFPLV